MFANRKYVHDLFEDIKPIKKDSLVLYSTHSLI